MVGLMLWAVREGIAIWVEDWRWTAQQQPTRSKKKPKLEDWDLYEAAKFLQTPTTAVHNGCAGDICGRCNSRVQLSV